jgi:hypothetical protein
MVPRSPKTRRRLVRALGLALVVAVVATVVAALPDRHPTPQRAQVAPAAPAQPPPAAPKPVALPKRDRKAIDRALDRFVPAAVDRADPARAYDLVTPALRAGTTRRDWATGSIPVQPFPARGRSFHHWTLSYSYRNHVGLELLLAPRRGADVGPIAFAVDFRRIGNRWLVDSFIPAAVFAAPGKPPRITAVPDFGPATGTSTTGRARLSTVWLLLPAALLSLIVIVPLGFALVHWRRGRRAVRAYEAGLDNPRGLPPLPAPARSRVALERSGRGR